MKKQTQNEKKLSLKKMQMTKINNMKAVYGGKGDTTYGNSNTRTQPLNTQPQFGYDGNGGNDDTIATKPKTLGSGI